MDTRFVAKDSAGQKLSYIYCEERKWGRPPAARNIRGDGPWRIIARRQAACKRPASLG